MAGKAHGNGEGTIGRRKDGRWYARYHALTSEGKKRKTVYDKTRQDEGRGYRTGCASMTCATLL
ncbi:MAG: hypothetical protein AVDCRST_MAG28-1499 [uncultured Rubrobacteraceae bacterium]|uniref:Uncharacterized protein n=1 Tax=uncultured Rubrobacteraceae bacterium TaxID=349277 RepID=A0A6J4Q327_9ACTN|nr:MAG: hypothetical protein AVDCRST_MAG28-1499 [uncultured Rubrobacteraceae bacterium]